MNKYLKNLNEEIRNYLKILSPEFPEWLLEYIYTPDMLPAKFQWAITFNPIAQLINAYRDVLYYHQLPNMTSLGIVGLISLVALGLGYMIFKKLERNFVEEL